MANIASFFGEGNGDRPLVVAIKEGRLLVAPELAKRILAEANYERQRPVYSHHIVLLADAMRRNKWTAGSQIAFALFGGRLHLVNGQHRMHAVIQAGRSIEFQVLIEPCQTMAEVDALYYRFDVQQRKRSIAEVLNAAEVADRHGLSKGLAKATYEAVALIMNGMQRPNYAVEPIKASSIDARLDAARTWWPIAAKYEAFIESAPKAVKRKLVSAGITAVALVTIKYQEAEAEKFWRGVADNDGLRKHDPRHTFVNDILVRRLSSGSISQPAVVASLSWNAFFEGRDQKIVKVHSNAVIRIAGTPFDGRRS